MLCTVDTEEKSERNVHNTGGNRCVFAGTLTGYLDERFI